MVSFKIFSGRTEARKNGQTASTAGKVHGKNGQTASAAGKVHGKSGQTASAAGKVQGKRWLVALALAGAFILMPATSFAAAMPGETANEIGSAMLGEMTSEIAAAMPGETANEIGSALPGEMPDEIAATVPAAATAAEQGDDSGSWLSVQVNKPLNRAYVMARFEHRSFHQFSDSEVWFGMAGAGYKFTNWLKGDLSYEYWHIYPEAVNHKIVLCATETLAQGPLSVAVREKLEYAINPAGSNNCTLRTRLRVQYSAPSSTVRPYVMSEIFTWSNWKRALYYVGADVVVSKHSAFDLFYLYHVPNGAPSEHVIGVGYVLNL